MFPVVAICGHLWGFDMTATGIIPLAVLTGFAFNRGRRLFLYLSGMAAIISTNLGTLE